MSALHPIIYKLENTFSKDDIKSAPREVLEELIISIYDELNELQRIHPEWE